MLRSSIVRLVDFCARFPWPISAPALVRPPSRGASAARLSGKKPDTTAFSPPTLSWAQRATAYMKAFPQRDILVVLDAPSPEFADAAAAKLAAVLAEDHE